MSKDITVAYKQRAELREDVACLSAVLDALLEKRAAVEVRCLLCVCSCAHVACRQWEGRERCLGCVCAPRACKSTAYLMLRVACVACCLLGRQAKIKRIGELRSVGFVEGAALQKLRLLQGGYRSRATTLATQLAALRSRRNDEASQLFQTYVSRLGMEVYHAALADSVDRLRAREVSSRRSGGGCFPL